MHWGVHFVHQPNPRKVLCFQPGLAAVGANVVDVNGAAGEGGEGDGVAKDLPSTFQDGTVDVYHLNAGREGGRGGRAGGDAER